ncbi:uncharacterized protein LOC143020341 [Oratosquilla oratoria]|uniref:uncharacterized protein LOC143020341 n=1 Tax=Oratosquilla oratoria TaxID=337810 RepID=UPI003F75FA05
MKLRSKTHEVNNFVLLVLHVLVLSAHEVASKSADLSSDFKNAKPLLCDVHCSCFIVNFFEYKVVCNKTTAKEHILTAEVFDPRGTKAIQSKQTYVLVQDMEQVLVTENFLLEWERYKSSALDLWGIGNLVFESRTKITKKRTRLDFGGVGIMNSTVSQLPKGLINNKIAASLLFFNTTVDIIPSETLVGVDKLRYLVVNRSRIGILKGSPVSRPISLNRRRGKLTDILIRDSFFGTIEGNALHIVNHLSYRKPEQFTISNSKIGLLERNGIQLEGKLAIQVSETFILNAEAESLKINTTSSVNIVNNTFVGQPGLLADLPCDVSTVVQKNLFISIKPRVWSSGSQTNKDTDSPEESLAPTDQPEDENKATHNSRPTDVTGPIATTTVIPEPRSLLQDPALGSSEAPPVEKEDPFFHPSCVPNLNIHRDSIMKEEVSHEVKEEHKVLSSKSLVFLLTACCILLLIALFCMAICNRMKKKNIKNKMKIDKDHIYNEPAFLWRARQNPPPVLSSAPPTDPPHGVYDDPYVVMVSDDPNSRYENCQSGPGSSYSTKSLGRPQESPKVMMENDYCTMRSSAAKANTEKVVCCSSRT